MILVILASRAVHWNRVIGSYGSRMSIITSDRDVLLTSSRVAALRGPARRRLKVCKILVKIFVNSHSLNCLHVHDRLVRDLSGYLRHGVRDDGRLRDGRLLHVMRLDEFMSPRAAAFSASQTANSRMLRF